MMNERKRLAEVEPSPRAVELAASLGKGQRMVEVAGEAGEGVPAMHGRGFAWNGKPAPARALVRERDHFQ